MAKYIFVNRFFYPDHSATSQLLSDLVFHLSRYEPEIHVVTSRRSYDDPTLRLPAHETIDGISIHRIWTSNYGRMNIVGRAIDYVSFYLFAFLKLIQLVSRNDVLITKTDPPLMSIITTFIAKIFRAKRINWIQDLFPEVAINLNVRKLQGKPGRILVRLRNYSLKGCQNVVLGERMRQKLVKEGINRDDIKIIPNWVNGKKIRPVNGDNPLRKEWGLEGKFVVGYSGNLGRAHDSETIINAMVTLKESKNIVFLFIGGGSHLAKVQQACEVHNLTNVLFKPYQPRDLLHLSLSAADVHWLVLQPQLEGLIVPSKFYGIAASGRPMIFLGDTEGEIAAVINQYSMGFVAPLGDYQALVNKFNLLASNSSLCQTMGANSREVFDNKFNHNIALKSWERVIFAQAEPESAAENALHLKEAG
jgi:glycosyltransferase involved in cell wall biosynthesis